MLVAAPEATIYPLSSPQQYWGAWRIDTVTGRISFCTYNAGEKPTVDKPWLQPVLECENGDPSLTMPK